LDFGAAVSLPWRLRLVWEGTGQSAECEVRHVRGGQSGVQFICANGPRIARESIALSSAGQTSAPLTLAPAPQRETIANTSGSLVQKFRDARQPAKVAPSVTEAPVQETVSDISTYVPLPLAAASYAAIAQAFAAVPRPLSASAYAAL
jgi:hypothetical protein